MEELQQEIRLRSFWKPDSDRFLLPEQNLSRELYLATLNELSESNLVLSLMGQRRAGKSVIARQFIKRKREQGIPAENILYINFFLKPLVDLRSEEVFYKMINWWSKEIINKEHRSFLILDEVHELENWDENVASLFEDVTFPVQIIISGSNSKILSEELSSNLGGRYTAINVFPFSFQEFCEFTGYPETASTIELYLQMGGMPEVLKVKNEEEKLQLISDIITSTVRYDIVRRYNPTNPQLLYALIDYCRSSFSKQLSTNSITRAIMSGARLDTHLKASSSSLVESYIHYIQDVYFIHLPETYSYRSKDVLQRSVDKMYIGDLTFANYKQKTEKGRLLENMIFLELIRRRYKIKRFLGYRNRNLEIDFHIERKNQEALVQVCWLLGDAGENSSLWEREFGNLYKTNLEIPKIVVSLDETILNTPYKDVQHMNVLEFLTWIDE